jgi:L-2-amino-thiazoline-4-carboxylic acid hydrolase
MEINFTASQHAILFALLSRAAFRQLGDEEGEKVVRQAVRKYGEQRGHRMALRVQRDGEPLSMLNFMAYSEWRVGSGETEQAMAELFPDARSFVTRCPWHQAWLGSDLLSYGRLYCREIDHALVRGFNPSLQLDVLSTLSNDDRPCEFVYHQAHLTPENLEYLDKRRLANQENGGVKSWEYHVSHLFHAFKSTLCPEYGNRGDTILQEALTEVALQFGEGAAQAILSFQAVDFDRLPE